MAFLGPALSFLAANAGTIATVASAVGTLGSALSQRQAAKAEAALAAQQAEQLRGLGQLAAERTQRERIRRLGAITAAAGASGTGLSGSPLDVLADTAAESVFEEQSNVYDFESRARVKEFERDLAKGRARQALLGGAVGLASSIKRGSTPDKPKPEKASLTIGGGF